jgi:hypothetical protein
MPAQPATTPIWATAGAIIVPPLAKQALGWIVEKPPHQTYNWWQNLVFQWVDHYRITVDIEHDLDDGTHTDVTADTLTVAGNVGLASFAPLGATDFSFLIADANGAIAMRDQSGNMLWQFDPVLDTVEMLGTLVPGQAMMVFERGPHRWNLVDSTNVAIMVVSNGHLVQIVDGSAQVIFEVASASERVRIFDAAGVSTFDVDASVPSTTVAQGTLLVTDQVQRTRTYGQLFGVIDIDDHDDVGNDDTGFRVTTNNDNGTIRWPIHLPVGSTLTQIEFFFNVTAGQAANVDLQARLKRIVNTTSTATVEETVDYLNVIVGDQTLTMTVSPQIVIASSSSYVIEVFIDELAAANSNIRVHGARLTYDINDVHT